MVFESDSRECGRRWRGIRPQELGAFFPSECNVVWNGGNWFQKKASNLGHYSRGRDRQTFGWDRWNSAFHWRNAPNPVGCGWNSDQNPVLKPHGSVEERPPQELWPTDFFLRESSYGVPDLLFSEHFLFSAINNLNSWSLSLRGGPIPPSLGPSSDPGFFWNQFFPGQRDAQS